MDTWSVLDRINTARGMGSSNQCYNVLYTVARAFNVSSIVEIGTYLGASSIVMTQAVLDNGYTPVVHTIDNYLIYTDHRFERIKEGAVNNIDQAGLSGYITMYDGDSLTILPGIFASLGNKVDLCFIDGDHTIQGATNDFLQCEPFSNLLVLHDTGQGDLSYLDLAREKGYTVLSIPTRYIEGDGHLVGISIVYRKQ